MNGAFHHLHRPEFKLRQHSAALTQAFATPRAAVAYIIDTFLIDKRKDEAQWGDFRAQHVILEIYDDLAGAMRTDEPAMHPGDPALRTLESVTPGC